MVEALYSRIDRRCDCFRFASAALPACWPTAPPTFISNRFFPARTTAIKNYLDQQKPAEQHKVAQAPPVPQQPIGPVIALPGGLSYTLDVSSAYPFGNIGTFGKGWLMGGMDASVGYGLNWSTRVVASMFQLQHFPTALTAAPRRSISPASAIPSAAPI